MSTLSAGTDASPTGLPLANGKCGSTPCLTTDNGLPECCSVNGYCGTNSTYCLGVNNCQYGCIDPSFFLLPATALPSSLSSLQRQPTSSTAAPSSTSSSSITSIISSTTLQTTTTSSHTTSSSSSSGTHSPSPTSSAASGSKSSSHISTGAIAGAAVGGFIAVALAAFIIWFCCCRDRGDRSTRTETPLPRSPVRQQSPMREARTPTTYPPYHATLTGDPNALPTNHGDPEPGQDR